MASIILKSDNNFRWRIVGTETWNNVLPNVDEEVVVDAGVSIELSSTVDNSTLKVTGSVSSIDILSSKITNLVASFKNISNLETLRISSDSEVADTEHMLHKTKITEELSIEFVSTSDNARYYLSDLTELDESVSISSKNGYSRFNLVSIPAGSKTFPIEDSINEISNATLDLRNVGTIDTLSGEPVKALDEFGVVISDGRVSCMGIKQKMFEDFDDAQTLELSLGVKEIGDTIIRDPIANEEFYTTDNSKTLELDLGLKEIGDVIVRDSVTNYEFEAPDTTKTLEIDLGMDNLGDVIIRDTVDGYSFEEQDQTKTLEIDLGLKEAEESIMRDTIDDSNVFSNDTSDTINYTLEFDLYAPADIVDIDGVAYSADNQMDITQLPA